MTDAETLVATIGDIAMQTRAMLAAAQAGDWERLIDHERRRRLSFAAWARIAQAGTPLPASCRENAMTIQALDAEIQQLAAARFTVLKEELAVAAKRQKLAYHYSL